MDREFEDTRDDSMFTLKLTPCEIRVARVIGLDIM